MTSVTSPRDVLLILLTSALMRFEHERMDMGQLTDLLIAMLAQEGYVIEKKKRC